MIEAMEGMSDAQWWQMNDMKKGGPKAALSSSCTRLSQPQRLHDPDQQARDPVQHQRPPDPQTRKP